MILMMTTTMIIIIIIMCAIYIASKSLRSMKM